MFIHLSDVVQLSICSLQNSRRPLHVAAEKGHSNIVSLLLTHGANADSKDKVRYRSMFQFCIITDQTNSILDNVYVQ